MGSIKWNFLLLAILAAASIVGMGVALAEYSLIGILVCFIIFMAVTGYGFATKKKYRDAGKL